MKPLLALILTLVGGAAPANLNNAVQPSESEPVPTAIIESVKPPVVEGTVAEPAPEQTGKAAWLNASTIDDHYHADLVIHKESSWRVDVINSIGCIGLGQSCPNGSGLLQDCPDWKTNPVCQLNHFDRYVKRRYGSWASAWQFHIANNWY